MEEGREDGEGKGEEKGYSGGRRVIFFSDTVTNKLPSLQVTKLTPTFIQENLIKLSESQKS